MSEHIVGSCACGCGAPVYLEYEGEQKRAPNCRKKSENNRQRTPCTHRVSKRRTQ